MHANTHSIMVAACALLTLALLAGCETEPSEQMAITITPNNVTLRPGESQEFTATGLQDYTWEIRDSDGKATSTDRIAVLSTKKGNSTIYTAVSGTNMTRVLRVSANVRSGTQTTDPPATETERTSVVFAEAIITHRP